MRFCMVTTFYPPDRRALSSAVKRENSGSTSIGWAIPRSPWARACARAHALIERHVGRPPRYFTYPRGHHDATARDVAAERYRAAFPTRLAVLRDGDDRYALPRLDAHSLRGDAVRRRLDGAGTPAWLAWRASLRRLRGRP